MSDGLRLLAAIVERGSTGTFRLLDESFFVDNDELSVYRFVRTHNRRYGELPAINTIEARVDVEIPDSPEAVDYYLNRVYERKMFNAVRPLWNDMREALIDIDVDRVKNLSAAMYTQCRISIANNDLETIGTVGQKLIETYNDSHISGDVLSIPTGWVTFDIQTGGYQNGDLVIWVARPELGKTHLLIHQAKAAWMSGKSVLFVSTEMPQSQIGMRFYSHVAKINPEYVRKSQLSYWVEARYKNTIQLLDNSNRFYLYGGGGRVNKKVDDIDIIIQEIMPDIVYIDGIYLLNSSSSRNNSNRFEKVADVLDDLKNVTIDRDRPVVGTTQFNRVSGKGGKEGSLETIGYTDAISTHSSIIASIKFPAKKQLGLIDRRKIEVLKVREGGKRDFLINYSFSPLNFEEVEEDTVKNRRRKALVDVSWQDDDSDS